MKRLFVALLLLLLLVLFAGGAAALEEIVPLDNPASTDWEHISGCRAAYFNKTAAYISVGPRLLCTSPSYLSHTRSLNTTGYYDWKATFQITYDFTEMADGTLFKIGVGFGRTVNFFSASYSSRTGCKISTGYGSFTVVGTWTPILGAYASTVVFSKGSIEFNFATKPATWYRTTVPFSARITAPSAASFGASWTTSSTKEPYSFGFYNFGLTGEPCPASCSSCISNTTCTSCVREGYDPATLCTQCLDGWILRMRSVGMFFLFYCAPICANSRCECEAPGGCDACIGNFTNPETYCTDCPIEGQVFDPATGNCTYKTVTNMSTLCPALPEANCSAMEGCQWCTLNSRCRSAEFACPWCTDFYSESTCNVTGLSEGCKWCSIEGRCSEPTAFCISSCSQLFTQSSCDGAPSCRWVEDAATGGSCMNATEFLTFMSVENCTELDETACSNTSTCMWCDNDGGSCIKSNEECSVCTAITSESSCVHMNTSSGTAECAWCSASEVCSEAPCAECSWASAEHCGSGDYSACRWCQAALACIPAAYLADCDCGHRANISHCEASTGCQWCDSVGSCTSVDVLCTPCDSRSETSCTSPCRWSGAMQSCSDATKSLVLCSSYAPMCTIFPGCEVCEDDSCKDIGMCNAGGDSSAKKDGSAQRSSDASGGGGNNLPLPLWMLAAIGAGGVALLAVIISAAVCIVIAGKRRKRKHVSEAERSEIAMATVTTALTTGELAGMHSVPASEMLLEVSKSTLTFGSKHAILKLDAPVETTFELTNTGKKEAHVTAHVPPADETEGRYDLRVQPESVTLGPSESCTLSVTLTPRCTMTIKTAVALWRHPAKSFTMVDVEGEVELSTRLDWNELQISQQLGKGGFGTVYKATWRGMPVAVKEMASHIWEIADTRAEVMREVDLMNRLRSPFIVCFHGVVMTNAHKAIVMELAPMGSVKSILSKQQLTNQVRVKIAMNCAAGMQLLHANGIMHRDLKADNLLVFSLNPREEVLVKLTDFGTSRCVADEEARQYTKGIGTPCWMAPEILDGQAYGMAADVYSFGVTLYELVAQKEPYCDFENHFAIVAFVSDGKRLEIPPSPLADLTTRCWAHDPAARPTFAQIVADLSALVS